MKTCNTCNQELTILEDPKTKERVESCLPCEMKFLRKHEDGYYGIQYTRRERRYSKYSRDPSRDRAKRFLEEAG